MRDCYTIDIEGAIVAAMQADGIDASAPPVTADLEAGCVVVYRVGGTRQNYVQDAHQLSIDCYAETDVQACALANRVCGWLGDLEGFEVGGVPVYRSRPTTLPYENQDPMNRHLFRYTLAAQVITRVTHQKQ